MATEHVLIPDAQRHEVKGASTATVGQAVVCNGTDSTQFAFIDYNTLTNKPTVRGYLLSLTGSSIASSQQPSATNTPYQIEFGSAQSTTDVNVSATGVITFVTAGQYLVVRTLRVARTALTGVANLFVRHLIGGIQSGNSSCVSMDNNLDTVTLTSTIIIDAAAGSTMTTEIVRDSSGVNVGGLFSATPAASGWSVAPSASISVYKYKGVN